MSKPMPFRKMRLVPIDDSDASADDGDARMRSRLLAEKRIRLHDPVISSMADLLPGIEHPTTRVSSSGKVQRRNPTAALAVQNASLQRYKALERQRAPAISAYPVDLRDRTAPAAPVVEATAPAAAAASSDVAPLLDVQVPHMYAKKLGRLLEQLSSAPGVIGRTESDELVIDGVVHRGTSFSGAMRGLFVNYTTPPPGTRQLVTRLRKLGVPKGALSSKAALGYYSQAGSGLPRFPGRPGRVLRVYPNK